MLSHRLSHFTITVSVTRRAFSTLPTKGLIKLKSKNLLSIKGPDSTKFINGLITSKLLPSFTKKNQTTISEQDLKELQNSKSLDITESQITDSNWGMIHEDEYVDDDDESEEHAFRLGIRRDGRFSMLLNSKGRLISDLFVYPTPLSVPEADLKEGNVSDPSYLIEFNNMAKFNQSLMMLKLHKLKSKIDIRPKLIESWFYFNRENDKFDDLLTQIKDNYFNNAISKSPSEANKLASKFITDQSIFNQQQQNNILGFAIDDRASNFGIRFLKTPETKIDTVFSDKFISEFGQPEIHKLDTYETLRVSEGIVESSDYPKSKADSMLPFENNVDFMGGINYNKGCYVGQELTIRTYYSGVVRKRVLPVQFYLIGKDGKVGEQDEINFDPNDGVVELISGVDDLELVAAEDEKGGSSSTKSDTEDATATVMASSPFGGSGKKPVRARRRRKRSEGSVFKVDGNLGFATLNLNSLKDDNSVGVNEFIVNSDSHPEFKGKVGCKVYIPEWWPEGFNEDEE
ncbi:unnamed protein product [Ambrosiozyma monospora]|uniref:Unnamed protein product n=1 Tax=Ambrosiozyma monospora TaxID=43982 RepID=A0ACB5T5S9_AMBMO|nr:unnamed protein product [Ambrosiozyma monospora]